MALHWKTFLRRSCGNTADRSCSGEERSKKLAKKIVNFVLWALDVKVLRFCSMWCFNLLTLEFCVAFCSSSQ